MGLESTPAYITTVAEDRTITLPADIPAGARVAVILLSPTESAARDAARRARFAETKRAVRAASTHTPEAPAIDEAALDALIRAARRA